MASIVFFLRFRFFCIQLFCSKTRPIIWTFLSSDMNVFHAACKLPNYIIRTFENGLNSWKIVPKLTLPKWKSSHHRTCFGLYIVSNTPFTISFNLNFSFGRNFVQQILYIHTFYLNPCTISNVSFPHDSEKKRDNYFFTPVTISKINALQTRFIRSHTAEVMCCDGSISNMAVVA